MFHLLKICLTHHFSKQRQGTGDFTRMYRLMNIDNSHHVPTKRSSLQSHFDKLKGAEKIILVHNTFTTEEDVPYVNRQS